MQRTCRIGISPGVTRLSLVLVSFAGLTAAPPAFASSLPHFCLQFFSYLVPARRNDLEPGERIDLSTPDEYLVDDTTHISFSILGAVRNRVLGFSITTEIPNGARSPHLRAAEEFKRMLKHFEGRFDAIEGDWQSNPDAPSRNLTEFNEWTSPPYRLSPEAAARRTWTGQQCEKAGFTDVKIEETEMKDGKYTVVVVHFLR